jgi:competence protein ComEA
VVRQALVSRINPNTADAALLMTLPNIGPARAAAIVEYRNQQNSGAIVFRRVEDLQAVKGIGPKISEGLRPWLDFETRIATAEE